MPLSSDDISLLAEAVRETSAVVSAAVEAADLNTSDEGLLIDDAELYERIRNSFVRFKGDGVDFDNERKREAIFYRVRRLLGLPYLVFDQNFEMMELVELEVGQNFG